MDYSHLMALKKNPFDVWNRITEYTARGLTYQSDILNGMLGLLRAFRKLGQPVYRLWDVPIFHSPYLDTKFPSWSWTGWKGQVEFVNYKHFYQKGLRLDEKVNIWIELEDGFP